MFFRLSELAIRCWFLGRLLIIRVIRGRRLAVVFRDIGIGDVVCTFAIVKELQKQNPERLVVYLCLPRFRDFVRRFSGADVVLGSRFVHYARPVPQLPAWLGQAFFPRYVNDGTTTGFSERSDYVTEMAISCGLSSAVPPPRIEVGEKHAKQWAERLGSNSKSRPHIGIHLGPSAPVREWRIEHWRSLISELQSALGARVVRLGSSWHHAFEGNIDKLAVDFDLTDQLDLVETTELISGLDLFIGIDSGLIHIARAVGVPIVGLFGPTDPSIVLGSNRADGLFAAGLDCIFCQSRKLNLHWNTGCPYDIRCMRLLTPEMVLARAQEKLNRAPS